MAQAGIATAGVYAGMHTIAGHTKQSITAAYGLCFEQAEFDAFMSSAQEFRHTAVLIEWPP